MRPDAGGEGFDHTEPELFIQPYGDLIPSGYGEGEFGEVPRFEGMNGSLHQLAAQAVPLVSRQYTDLRRVADALGDR